MSPRFDPPVWDAAVADHDGWMPRLEELGAAAVIGSRPVTRDGVRLNEGFGLDARAGYRAIHDKRFLPDEEGYWEAKWYAPGDGRFRPPIHRKRPGRLAALILGQRPARRPWLVVPPLQ